MDCLKTLRHGTRDFIHFATTGLTTTLSSDTAPHGPTQASQLSPNQSTSYHLNSPPSRRNGQTTNSQGWDNATQVF